MKEDLIRYPTGRFEPLLSFDEEVVKSCLDQMARCSEDLRLAVEGFSDAQLDTAHREDGWTVRQIVHHVSDSHINGYIRFKMGLTEHSPVIATYEQDEWAALQDSLEFPVDVSLNVLESLHLRWIELMRGLKRAAWDRTIQHPESGPMALHVVLQLYAWHGHHHVGHITGLAEREGW